MTTPDRDARRRAIAVAALCFAAAAPLVYMASMTYDHVRGVVSDPRLVVMATHTAFYWRAALGAWFACVVAGAVFAGLRGKIAPEREERATARALAAMVACTGAATALAFLYP